MTDKYESITKKREPVKEIIEKTRETSNTKIDCGFYKPYDTLDIATAFDNKIRALMIEQNGKIVKDFYVPAMHVNMGYILLELSMLSDEDIVKIITKSLEAGNIEPKNTGLGLRVRLAKLFKHKLAKPPINYVLATETYTEMINSHKQEIRSRLETTTGKKEMECDYYPEYNRTIGSFLHNITKAMELEDFPKFLKKVAEETLTKTSPNKTL